MTETDTSVGNGRRRTVAASTEEVIDKTRSALRPRLEHQPYLVMGLAFGVGYILAAGIPVTVASYLARYGIRTAVSSLVRHLYANVFEPEGAPAEEQPMAEPV